MVTIHFQLSRPVFSTSLLTTHFISKYSPTNRPFSEPKSLFYRGDLLGRSNRVNAIIVVFEQIPEM
jgi:hypothetical protein